MCTTTRRIEKAEGDEYIRVVQLWLNASEHRRPSVFVWYSCGEQFGCGETSFLISGYVYTHSTPAVPVGAEVSLVHIGCDVVVPLL